MQRRRFLISSSLQLTTGAATAAIAESVRARLAGQTLEGQAYDLRQDQGKVVLVFFWATDCPVCRDKMPELRANYEGWRDKGFQLLAVNVDKTLETVLGYDKILNRIVPVTQQFPWLWRGARSHRDNFGSITHTPTSFLVNRRGAVVKEFRGRIEAGLWDDIAELVLA